MMKKKPKQLPVLRFIASLKLTVICLLILVIIIIWGTVYQADKGLFQAQQKFFHSWFFLLFGFIPFPGTVVILWILFINLTGSLIFRIPLKWKNMGKILIHVGLMILLVGGFISSFLAEESVISLREGEDTHLSSSYHNWELAVWQGNMRVREVFAVDSGHFKANEKIRFDQLNLSLKILRYYKNCTAYLKEKNGGKENVINSSGIGALEIKKPEMEPSQNSAGVIFIFDNVSSIKNKILLFGKDPRPTGVTINNKKHYLSIRKKRKVLPFSLRLIDFKRVMYPGSNIVRSYESRVEIITRDFKRKVLIAMNKPLRYRDFSVFQSSYFITKNGTEYSVFAVVKNSLRLSPYVSSILVIFGLLFHFLVMFFLQIKKGGNRIQ